MILIDRNIKELVNSGELIIRGYDESNVNSISYDLTIGSIVKPKENDEEVVEEIDTYTLEPNEFIFIKTNEQLKIPINILGRVAEKNSLMRTGLVVSGPHYQPGHTTYAFLRVHNTSYRRITLNKNQKVAQIIFEQLKETPEIPYNIKSDSSFNNEDTYRGYGNYKNQYKRSMKKLEKVKSDIESKESKIYSNILTFMGIFVSIFSLITINFEAFSKMNLSIQNLMLVDLSLALVVTLFMGLILIFINNKDNKHFAAAFIIILVILVVLNTLALSKLSANDAQDKSNQTNIEQDKSK
ncbi:hypothetical protein [Clostridium sp. YIM B02500]|uniref:dCTP deaminase n=1 Tax=Clostridium sp. YIM B02500 TaxID=2910681 RepID=UPI001EEEF2EF|nr:hypothetical protein [Clostridium sp. YIM B02500]